MDFVPYQIRRKVEPGLLHYYVTGERQIAAAWELWQGIINDSQAMDIDKAIITLMLKGRYHPLEIPWLVRRLSDHYQGNILHSAWVDLNAESYRDNLIGEKVPHCNSLNFKVFDNEVAALAWLTQQ